jgi:hypothetical protein
VGGHIAILRATTSQDRFRPTGPVTEQVYRPPTGGAGHACGLCQGVLGEPGSCIFLHVRDDPAYSDVEGFVLGGPSQAIIANWVRGKGIWHVDTARRASVLSDFREASGHAGAHSVTGAPSPAGWLRALAGYLA